MFFITRYYTLNVFHYTLLHAECFLLHAITRCYTVIMCFWWDLRFSVTLLQWPVPATNARPFLDVLKGELGRRSCTTPAAASSRKSNAGMEFLWINTPLRVFSERGLNFSRIGITTSCTITHHYTSLHCIAFHYTILLHVSILYYTYTNLYYTPLHALLHTN